MESENKNMQDTNQVENTELVQLKGELETCKSKVLYFQAEFDNYKKRMEREQKSWMERAQEYVLLDLLPIVDNFELALQHMTETEKDNKNFAGIDMISKELSKLLKKYHVEEITQNSEFNPEFHEAVMQQQQEGKPSGSIITVFKKGYTLNNRVIRPAQVSVVE